MAQFRSSCKVASKRRAAAIAAWSDSTKSKHAFAPFAALVVGDFNEDVVFEKDSMIRGALSGLCSLVMCSIRDVTDKGHPLCSYLALLLPLTQSFSSNARHFHQPNIFIITLA